MKIKNSYLFSLLSSFSITILTTIGIGWFIHIECKELQLKPILIFSIGFFIVVFFLIRKSVTIYLNNRVNEIYRNSPLLKRRRLSQKTYSDEMDILSKEINKSLNRKEKEIAKLNYREDYRKDFLGNVSHELKTPLFTVQGYLLTLIEGAAEDREIRNKYLERANNGIERLSEIVNDLDLITKLETNDLKLKIEPFNIIALINKVFDLLEMQAKKRNINLTMDKFYEFPEYVLGDKAKIEQVLINLVMNSIKYGKNNGSTVIRINYLDDDKIEINVADNGEGISNSDMRRIFERFYRVDKSRSRDQGGSGLGLSIVKHIIESHDQNIYVDSKLGKGSTFTFTLEKVS